MQYRRLVWVLVVLGLAYSVLATKIFAQEDVELERIVVTPYRYAEDIGKAVTSVTVITEAEIRSSGAKTVLDAIRPVTGIVVRDFFGNNTQASVDFRGFGEQGGLNVLILVDGRRVNEVDISGVDWNQIPLNQVEKIEIIRGGNSVLYGDNAVSAVINIITKTGEGKPRLELGTSAGSFDFNSQDLSLTGAKDKLSYWIAASHNATHGYRKNSFYKSNDFTAKLNYDVSDSLSLHYNYGYHRSIYGLPGALSDREIERFGRKHSKFGDDHAKNKDYYFVLGLEKDFRGLGEFTIDVSYSDKKVYTNFIGANMGWNPVLRSVIKTLGATPKYKLDKQIFKRDNTFLLGLDFYRYDYSLNNYDVADTLENMSDINKISLSGYLQDEFSILKNLILVGGFRYESAKYEFDFHDNSIFFPFPDVDKDIMRNNKAYNGGLVYRYKDDSSAYFNINQSFRFPAVDEYFAWGALNTDLKPQTSRNYELGIKHRFNSNLKCEISIYRMNVENELFYNPIGGPFGFGANENYDKTRHDGMDASFDLKLTKGINLFANYAYIKAAFAEGLYNKENVPMVPRHKGTLGMRFPLPKSVTLNVLGNYVAQRYFINDQANNFSRMNGYFTLDTNVSYAYKDFTATFGINNVFDKEYSEFGVCNNVTGAKNYYPSPGRNFSLRLEYKF